MQSTLMTLVRGLSRASFVSSHRRELSSKSTSKSGIPWCVSLSWSADGNTLFAGSTDGSIYVYEVGHM